MARAPCSRGTREGFALLAASIMPAMQIRFPFLPAPVVALPFETADAAQPAGQ